MKSEICDSEEAHYEDSAISDISQPKTQDNQPEKNIKQSYSVLDTNQAVKLIEHPGSLLGNHQPSKFMEQYRSVFGNNQIGKLMEQYRSILGDNQIGKLTEQYRSILGNNQIGKLMEQYRSILGDNQIGKLTEQYRSILGNNQIGKITEQYRSILGDNQIDKLTEQYRSILGNNQIGKITEQYRSVLGDNWIGKLMKQYRSVSSDTPYQPPLGELFTELNQTLAGISFEELINELKSRKHLEQEMPPGAEHTPQRTNMEAPVFPRTTTNFETQPEKQETSQLSKIPTWTLLGLIYLLTSLCHILASWEDIRKAITDINARLPQTASFSEARKLIRTELSEKPGDIRLVTGSNVNLREDPSMKSAIILQLPKNAPVAILGKEDRTWLLVSYEHDGYLIDGYVSTKFLKKIRKH